MTWQQLDDWIWDHVCRYEGRTMERAELPSVAW